MSSAAPDGRAIAARGAWLPPPARRKRGRARPNVSSMSLVLIAGATALLVGLAFAMQTTSYDIWGGLLVGSVLLLLTIPISMRAARRENDPRVGRVILLAALVKLSLGSAARYVVAYTIYKSSDAEGYYKAGVLYMPQIRDGDFGHLDVSVGTHFLEVVSGFVLAFTDETRLGEFVVFSWISFVGLYFFYQAFRIAFPEGDRRRYRLLIFFWPSMLFWPSSIGKDAWMVCMLGMAALGVANLLVGRGRGFVWFIAGSFGCIMVRPHLTVILISGFALALVFRRNRGTYSRMLARPLGTAVLMVGMIVAGAVAFQSTQSFFKLDSLDLESTQALLESTSEQTSEGGSSFEPPKPDSPFGYVAATVSVMFRPYPTEVGGAAFLTGLEGVLLAGLVVISARRIVRIPRMSLQNAYVAFATGYSAVFIFAFASISNFGILARERVQFFPILFVLFAIPKRAQEADPLDDPTADTSLVAAGA